MLKLYVDDVREAPPGWLLARTVEEAKHILQTEDITVCSLDHDMGEGPTGYDLLVWMMENGKVPPTTSVHSMNPVGRNRMLLALHRYWQLVEHGIL